MKLKATEATAPAQVTTQKGSEKCKGKELRDSVKTLQHQDGSLCLRVKFSLPPEAKI
jgi:hypothetical protein